jgi:hypothetical protein
MVNPDGSLIKRVELNTGDEAEYPQDTRNVSPTQSKPGKDFKKVLSKSSKEGREDSESKKKGTIKPFTDETPVYVEEVDVKPSKDDEENASDVASMSLFDLSKKTAQPKVKEPGEKVASRAPVEEVVAKVQSPSDLFKSQATPKKKFAVDTLASQVSDKEIKTAMPIEKKGEKFTYTQEQPDLSYVNPFAAVVAPQQVAAPVSETKIERPTPITTAEMTLLVEQLVKKMYTVTQKGQTDTVMTLDHLPLFKDARVVVSSFETARGQFNITFENLSQAAQRLLDLEENRRVLLNSLEAKGYNVQIFTTTTQIEQRLNVDETLAQQGKQDDRENQQQGDNPRKRQRDA